MEESVTKPTGGVVILDLFPSRVWVQVQDIYAVAPIMSSDPNTTDFSIHDSEKLPLKTEIVMLQKMELYNSYGAT